MEQLEVARDALKQEKEISKQLHIALIQRAVAKHNPLEARNK